MASSFKSAAARIDGAKSRGSKTPEGKRRSFANSLRRGLLAPTVALEDKTRDTFAGLLAALERQYASSLSLLFKWNAVAPRETNFC